MYRLAFLALLSFWLAWPTEADARHRHPVRGAVHGVAAKAKAVVGKIAHAGKAVLHRAAHPLHGRCKQ